MKEDKDNEILLLKQNVRDLERQLAEYTDTDSKEVYVYICTCMYTTTSYV